MDEDERELYEALRPYAWVNQQHDKLESRILEAYCEQQTYDIHRRISRSNYGYYGVLLILTILCTWFSQTSLAGYLTHGLSAGIRGILGILLLPCLHLASVALWELRWWSMRHHSVRRVQELRGEWLRFDEPAWAALSTAIKARGQTPIHIMQHAEITPAMLQFLKDVNPHRQAQEGTAAYKHVEERAVAAAALMLVACNLPPKR